MKVVEFNGNRFAIADDAGKVVDDAQGYGYTSKQKAAKAMWWKFKGGKSAGNENVTWWKKHRDLYDRVTEFIEINFKEIYRGKLTEDDVFGYCEKIAKEELNTEFPKKMFKFMLSKSGGKMLRKSM